jgi:hypothetical protein
MAKDKSNKKKGKKMKVAFDGLDDNDRVQVLPNPEPPAEEQDERWAFPDWDKRVAVSTRGKGDE